MGDKVNYKQFKYLTYRERTRKIRHILTQILPICVKMKELKLSGYNFLIGNVDLAKDALAFIQLLELGLQYKIKVKLNDLDNMDSFCVQRS